MESATPPLTLTLKFGNLTVVESTPDHIILDIGSGNFFRLHVPQVPHTVKVGDKLPLFTQVPYGPPRN